MKTALVTGGSRGIGKAISLSLGKSFNVVVGYSSSKDSAEEVVEDIVKSGGTATAIQIDVKSSESIENAFVTIEEEFDGVVCEGFVGNVLLKFAEGLSISMLAAFASEARKGALTRLGAWLCKPVREHLYRKMDYTEYGGVPLLGIDGISIISHPCKL